MESGTAGAGDLRVTGLTKRFGGVVAAAEVSLAVSPAGVHGLIGPNGAGKSTILGLISGFLRPDAGRIEFAGRDLARLPPSAIARLGVARTFQQAAPLAGMTTLENVMVGMHARYRHGVLSVLGRLPGLRREEHEVRRAARAALADFGLAAEAEADAADLTFGKLRFLEVARAVAMRPRILLLDEPAAGLNRVETERLSGLVRRLRTDGVGVLLVDHDVSFVFSLCDQVTVMNYGRVIASGPPAEIYRDPAVREAYLGPREPGAEPAR